LYNIINILFVLVQNPQATLFSKAGQWFRIQIRNPNPDQGGSGSRSVLEIDQYPP